MSQELTHILEITTSIIEVLGVIVLVLGFLISTGLYIHSFRSKSRQNQVKEFKQGIGRTILIGLEILVAATIVKTVIVEPTIYTVGLLAGMIAVRTLISWAIATEISGHWPWQSGK